VKENTDKILSFKAQKKHKAIMAKMQNSSSGVILLLPHHNVRLWRRKLAWNFRSHYLKSFKKMEELCT